MHTERSTRGVGVWPLRTVNFNRKRGFTSRRSRYSPSLHLSASWNFRSIAELWFVPQTSSYYPLQFLAEQNSPYVIIRREIIPCRKFSNCIYFSILVPCCEISYNLEIRFLVYFRSIIKKESVSLLSTYKRLVILKYHCTSNFNKEIS